MNTFYKLLVNTLIASVTNSFLWFSLTFWAYLETQSVLATAIIGGSFMLLSSLSSVAFGTYVDHHKKKSAMLNSSLLTLSAFSLASAFYLVVPRVELLTISNPAFWIFVLLILAGAIAGSLRQIALTTTVTLLVPKDERDRANGLVGSTYGVSFALTSVFSGLVIGYLGMGWALGVAVALTLLAALHLLGIAIPNDSSAAGDKHAASADFRGAYRATKTVPGLLALILFATFNNFLGGVFMALMDPYGLMLVSVEFWGTLWAVLSCGFIVGGLLVAKFGLGPNPLRTLFMTNLVLWLICIAFPLRSAIVPLALGMLMYMTLIPIVEASEHTIIQKVVPFTVQGRVFGFSQMVEQAASPLTSFLIGPIAQFWVIPFMTTGIGAETIGSWFGTGPERGIALIFMAAGLIGFAVTLLTMQLSPYQRLSKRYEAA